jgi:DNA-binding transcriptional ArsR family regulator
MLNRTNNQLRQVLEIQKALSDANRVRTLMALNGKELCVCQITELLKLAPSTVSKHLSILKQAGLVEARKNGRWIYYRLPKTNGDDIVSESIRLLEKSLENDQQIRADCKLLKKILSIDPEVLCGQ